MSILEYPLKSKTEDLGAMSVVKHENVGLAGSDAPASCTSLSFDPLVEVKTEMKMEVEVCYDSDGSVKHGPEDFMSAIGDEDDLPPASNEGDEGKPFVCNECGKSFSRESNLEYHMASHKSEMAFVCKDCGKSFSQKSNLKTHMAIHSGERPFVCNDCGNSFSQKSHLKTHMVVHTGERPFTCKDCGKSFSHKSSLKDHMVVHTGERPFVCDDCGKLFSQKSHLKTHMAIHTGEKPFVCKDCGKSFTRKSYLKRHVMNHRGQGSFVCTDCGKSFAYKSSLQDHLAIHTGERPFVCKDCGKSFSHKSNLKAHMVIHTGERPFVCGDCGKAFSHKSSLKTHVAIHRGKITSACKDCGKSFAHKSSLKDHMRIHLGEKPFACEECGQTFSWRNSLKRHLSTHAAVERSVPTGQQGKPSDKECISPILESGQSASAAAACSNPPGHGPALCDSAGSATPVPCSSDDRSSTIDDPAPQRKSRREDKAASGVLDVLLQQAESARQRPVCDPKLTYWRNALEELAADCADVGPELRMALKVEFISAVQRFVRATKEGITRPPRHLMPHTQAEALWDAPPAAPAPLPAAATYVSLATPSGATARPLNLTAQQVAMLHAQLSAPAVASTPRRPQRVFANEQLPGEPLV